jgi:hypothetical protein
MSTAKQSARELIEQLPDSVSWNELMDELGARQKLEQGLKELEDGEGISPEDRRRRLTGLAEARQRVARAGIAPMTLDEINSEIKGDRAERRAKPSQ